MQKRFLIFAGEIFLNDHINHTKYIFYYLCGMLSVVVILVVN